MLAVLSGGTGTPKLLQGLISLIKQDELSIIVNTGEDLEISGIYVSPDLDTVMYTLAHIVNEETWHGIRGDTFERHEELKRQGKSELLRIGDRDREVKQYRTELLMQGKTISETTRELCVRFGVRANVMPMSNDRITTRIYTASGPFGFHEFWVVRRAKDRVVDVEFENAERAKPAPGVLDAIYQSEAIVIGPSNPVTSIGPIISIKEIRKALIQEKEKIIAVSPIIGNAPVSGPAGVLMKGLGYEVSPIGVAKMYKEFIKNFIIDLQDMWLIREIENLGIKVSTADILLPNLSARIKLAEKVLEIMSTHKS